MGLGLHRAVKPHVIVWLLLKWEQTHGHTFGFLQSTSPVSCQRLRGFLRAERGRAPSVGCRSRASLSPAAPDTKAVHGFSPRQSMCKMSMLTLTTWLFTNSAASLTYIFHVGWGDWFAIHVYSALCHNDNVESWSRCAALEERRPRAKMNIWGENLATHVHPFFQPLKSHVWTGSLCAYHF